MKSNKNIGETLESNVQSESQRKGNARYKAVTDINGDGLAQLQAIADTYSDQKSPIQRKPIEVNGSEYKDDKFPDVRLEKISTGIYKILNDGTYKDRIIVYDVDDQGYFDKDPNGNFADFFKPFDLSLVSSVQEVQIVETLFNHIGENGKGVGDVTEDTTLRTTGLLTCVGWLLYNAEAAYLTHIVVDEPYTVVANGGISRQVNALAGQFERETGARPTDLIIKVDQGQRAYEGDELWQKGWMKELIPAGVTAQWIRGVGVLSHEVKPHEGQMKEWNGAPIRLSYDPEEPSNEDSNGDIWTGPNRVIPDGGIFEMDL